MQKLNQINLPKVEDTIEALFKKDVWHATEIGLKPDVVQANYLLDFRPIQPHWLKSVSKHFIRFQATRRSFNTCRHYILSIKHFGKFIVVHIPQMHPHQISRSVIIDYLVYLKKTNLLHATTKHMVVGGLRVFLEMVAQEQWLPFPKERLIFDSDIPPLPRNAIPRYIPEYVLSQLQTHLPTLPEYLQRLLFILQETGRRISEICTLQLNCLERDDVGDYFLKVVDHKMKKSYLIPITDACTKQIKMQRAQVIKENKKLNGYLFPSRKRSKNTSHNSGHLTGSPINTVLNDLAREKNITDENGEIWHFSLHQFRHTVGTRMINNGVSQVMVQKYLGHESPEMTSRYAHIHDQTLKKAFQEFNGKLVSAKGMITSDIQTDDTEAQWLKHNVLAQALPNGICHLPLAQQRCPHANACLTCSHFCTNKHFLPQHEEQLKETQALIERAKNNGWQRQLEMNEVVKTNLENIICTLKGTENESA